ncbi:MAG: pyridoxal 5'-phosphate synthase glutaminase subunit PdxT [Acidobacteria bacterium]|nr:pyridoxal 5'-phosphate synthase glutaminase subunit PdxT [Acidobacteriota bacterium]
MSAIGVLALQGDWAAHASMLRDLGVPAIFVRSAADFAGVRALVIPGGESSTMLRLMETEGLAQRIVERTRSGMPVLATCAGVILVAETVVPNQPSLGLLSVEAERNAYGRQVHSTVARIQVAPALGPPPQMDAVFIRAPRITCNDPSVEVFGTWHDDPVLVRQENILAATFHPELTKDSRVHQTFLSMTEAKNG